MINEMGKDKKGFITGLLCYPALRLIRCVTFGNKRFSKVRQYKLKCRWSVGRNWLTIIKATYIFITDQVKYFEPECWHTVISRCSILQLTASTCLQAQQVTCQGNTSNRFDTCDWCLNVQYSFLLTQDSSSFIDDSKRYSFLYPALLGEVGLQEIHTRFPFAVKHFLHCKAMAQWERDSWGQSIKKWYLDRITTIKNIILGNQSDFALLWHCCCYIHLCWQFMCIYWMKTIFVNMPTEYVGGTLN